MGSIVGAGKQSFWPSMTLTSTTLRFFHFLVSFLAYNLGRIKNWIIVIVVASIVFLLPVSRLGESVQLNSMRSHTGLLGGFNLF